MLAFSARAEAPAESVTLPGQSAASARCRVTGTFAAPAETPLYRALSGKTVVARLTGHPTPAVLAEFPRRSGRARIQTGTGIGGFRIDAYVALEQLSFYTQRALTIVPKHVWLNARERVSVIASAPGRLKVEKTLSQPIEQVFSTWAPCDALTLNPLVPAGHNVDGHARGYVAEGGTLSLFESSATKKSVITLRRAADAVGILFFSNERTESAVRVRLRGPILIDAWARTQELRALPPGETMDQLLLPLVTRRTSKLLLTPSERRVTATRPAPIRSKAKESEKTIGRVEAGGELYVLDIVAGWASVLPKAMNVAPPDGGHFWVRTSDLGL